MDDPVICPVPPKAFTHYMLVAPPIAGQREGGQRTPVQSRWARHFPKQVSFIHMVFCSKNLGNDSRHLLLPISHKVLCQLPLQPSCLDPLPRPYSQHPHTCLDTSVGSRPCNPNLFSPGTQESCREASLSPQAAQLQPPLL